MGGLLRKAVASIRKGSFHNNDRSILFNIAQLRKMKEKRSNAARVCVVQ